MKTKKQFTNEAMQKAYDALISMPKNDDIGSKEGMIVFYYGKTSHGVLSRINANPTILSLLMVMMHASLLRFIREMEGEST